MDLQDWHKRLDLEAKLTKRAREIAGRAALPHAPLRQALPIPPHEEAEQEENDDIPFLPVLGTNGSVPPRKGRGPRKMESREELLARLINPTLTLDETARLLQVCPTTVRRWTNKGILAHERSGGNQRRFKLSAVLDFLDTRERSATFPDAE